MSAAELAERVATLEAALETLHSDGVLTANSANTWYLIWAGLMVFFMQAGFGMLEAGSVTARSTQQILLKNLLDACVSAIAWWAMGHAIAFDGTNSFIGTATTPEATSFFAIGLESSSSTGYSWALWWFQWTFAATSSTIVSGAIAERAQLFAYLFYTLITTALVYPVIAHWVWSRNGWLSSTSPDAVLGGVIDFAGSGVVHLTGGTAALCGAWIIGPRTGRFEIRLADKLSKLGRPIPMPGHSAVLQALGTFLLWVGWYGFNAGSALKISPADKAVVIGRIFVTTTLSAAAAGVTSISLHRIAYKNSRLNMSTMCNSIMAGLVSIASGCATIPAWAALVIGALSVLVYRGTAYAVLHKLKIDDALEASAVHGACGVWGLLATALFTTKQEAAALYGKDQGGLFYGGGKLIGAAAIEICVIVTWSGILSSLLFFGLRQAGVLRSAALPLGRLDVDGPNMIMDASFHIDLVPAFSPPSRRPPLAAPPLAAPPPGVTPPATCAPSIREEEGGA